MSDKEDEKIVQEAYEALLDNCKHLTKKDSQDLIHRAFKLANAAHKGVKRRSGEPYILHPIEVAQIVAVDIGLGAKSVACALLHDVVEDTDYTIEDIRAKFGDTIANIIDGLTKISGAFDSNSSMQAENFKKMLYTLSDDVRVMLIKLADRLHNMRTLDSMSEQKQYTISAETVYLFAPLAHRLGLYSIKSEMEDLSLRFRHPEAYHELASKIQQSKKKRDMFINKFSLPIIDKLEQEHITYEITGRPKSVYSIWDKMNKKNIPYEEVYDLLAIRIVFDPKEGIPEKTQCWSIYSIITDIYMPKPDRIRDWVSQPKSNGYEALHSTVMGPNGNWVEVQIRSRRMDEIAERGFAAHWKYKGENDSEGEIEKWLRNIREFLQNSNDNAFEFLDEFKLNLFDLEIFVYTPKGKIITLPQNATCLDFAYNIHSEVGNRAIGAKVNHKLEALDAVLKSGDQVEIITSDKLTAQPQWMDFLVTLKAKTSLKQTLKGENKDRLTKGRKMLEEHLAKFGIKVNSRTVRKLLSAYKVNSKSELYSQIGSNIINLDNLEKILQENTQSKIVQYWQLSLPGRNKTAKKKLNFEKLDKNTPFVVHEEKNETTPDYEFSDCCGPIPGDDVVGYKNFNTRVIEIHKTNCSQAVRLMSNEAHRIIPIEWTTYTVKSFLVRIALSGGDKFGIYNEVITGISKDLNVNIRNINLSGHDGIFKGTIDLYVRDSRNLTLLMERIKSIKGIHQVQRVNPDVENTLDN